MEGRINLLVYSSIGQELQEAGQWGMITALHFQRWVCTRNDGGVSQAPREQKQRPQSREQVMGRATKRATSYSCLQLVAPAMAEG